MDKHPIEAIMRTTMENIRDMIDVNTVIGDAVETGDGTTVIPISRVSFGFMAGGGEYRVDPPGKEKLTLADGSDLPFAGGTGAGVTVHPMGFLVVGQGQVRMLSAQVNTPFDRIIDLVPQLLGDIKRMKKDLDEQAGDAKAEADAGPIPPAQPTHIVPPEPMTPHMYPDSGVHASPSPNPFDSSNGGGL